MDKIIEISSSQLRADQNPNSHTDDDKNKFAKSGRNNNKKCLFTLLTFIKSVFLSPDSCLLTILIFINFLIILYEFTCGIKIRSLTLISNSLHGIIHLGSFIFALIAYTLSRKSSNLHYTYGYSRIETLSAFINAFFLCFLAAFAFGSKIHHIIEQIGKTHDHSEKNEFIIFIHVIKTGFNASGALLFVKYAFAKPKFGSDEGHVENFQTLFLHFLLDGIYNILVLVDQFYDEILPENIDIAFNGILLVLTLIVCRPVLRNTGLVMLQSFPIKDEEFMSSAMREISVVEGVLNIKEKKFWGLHWGFLVCSLKIQVRNDVNREESLKDILQILKPKFKNVCVEFILDK